jgi:hypothetical protein
LSLKPSFAKVLLIGAVFLLAFACKRKAPGYALQDDLNSKNFKITGGNGVLYVGLDSGEAVTQVEGFRVLEATSGRLEPVPAADDQFHFLPIENNNSRRYELIVKSANGATCTANADRGFTSTVAVCNGVGGSSTTSTLLPGVSPGVSPSVSPGVSPLVSPGSLFPAPDRLQPDQPGISPPPSGITPIPGPSPLQGQQAIPIQPAAPKLTILAVGEPIPMLEPGSEARVSQLRELCARVRGESTATTCLCAGNIHRRYTEYLQRTDQDFVADCQRGN